MQRRRQQQQQQLSAAGRQAKLAAVFECVCCAVFVYVRMRAAKATAKNIPVVKKKTQACMYVGMYICMRHG